MENQFNEMAKYVNKNKDLLDRLMDVLKRLDDRNLLRQGRGLYKKMKDWDEKMMQRKSLAYDDVENFPNKFIADYLYRPRVSTDRHLDASEFSQDCDKCRYWHECLFAF